LIRDPAAYLADMLEHAQDVQAFVGGMALDAFLSDRKTTFAVLRALEVIGEAARDHCRSRKRDAGLGQHAGSFQSERSMASIHPSL
jgi:uncharacterized protein with HEPN domain